MNVQASTAQGCYNGPAESPATNLGRRLPDSAGDSSSTCKIRIRAPIAMDDCGGVVVVTGSWRFSWERGICKQVRSMKGVSMDKSVKLHLLYFALPGHRHCTRHAHMHSTFAIWKCCNPHEFQPQSHRHTLAGMYLPDVSLHMWSLPT